MKKVLKSLILLVIAFCAITNIKAEIMNTEDIPNNSYVIGKDIYHDTVLTTNYIMLSAKTIDSKKLDDMIIYYKSPRGVWMNGLTGEVLENVPDEFDIINADNINQMDIPTLKLTDGGIVGFNSEENKLIYNLELEEPNEDYEYYCIFDVNTNETLACTYTIMQIRASVEIGQTKSIAATYVKITNDGDNNAYMYSQKIEYSDYSNVVQVTADLPEELEAPEITDYWKNNTFNYTIEINSIDYGNKYVDYDSHYNYSDFIDLVSGDEKIHYIYRKRKLIEYGDTPEEDEYETEYVYIKPKDSEFDVIILPGEEYDYSVQKCIYFYDETIDDYYEMCSDYSNEITISSPNIYTSLSIGNMNITEGDIPIFPPEYEMFINTRNIDNEFIEVDGYEIVIKDNKYDQLYTYKFNTQYYYTGYNFDEIYITNFPYAFNFGQNYEVYARPYFEYYDTYLKETKEFYGDYSNIEKINHEYPEVSISIDSVTFDEETNQFVYNINNEIKVDADKYNSEGNIDYSGYGIYTEIYELTEDGHKLLDNDKDGELTVNVDINKNMKVVARTTNAFSDYRNEYDVDLAPTSKDSNELTLIGKPEVPTLYLTNEQYVSLEDGEPQYSVNIELDKATNVSGYEVYVDYVLVSDGDSKSLVATAVGDMDAVVTVYANDISRVNRFVARTYQNIYDENGDIVTTIYSDFSKPLDIIANTMTPTLYNKTLSSCMLEYSESCNDYIPEKINDVYEYKVGIDTNEILNGFGQPLLEGYNLWAVGNEGDSLIGKFEIDENYTVELQEGESITLYATGCTRNSCEGFPSEEITLVGGSN